MSKRREFGPANAWGDAPIAITTEEEMIMGERLKDAAESGNLTPEVAADIIKDIFDHKDIRKGRLESICRVYSGKAKYKKYLKDNPGARNAWVDAPLFGDPKSSGS